MDLFINETYSKPQKKNHSTNKTDVCNINDIWSLDILVLKDYGRENNRGYRHVLLVIDNFSKFRWTHPFSQNKVSQTIKERFENNLLSSKDKPNFFEADRAKEIYNSIFPTWLNIIKIKNYSRNTSLGHVYAERSNRTNRDLLKRQVFLKGVSNWIDVLPRITKHNFIRVHSSTNLTPTKGSLK